MEGNCHFLEFPAYKTHAVRCAAEVARPAGEPAQASELSATAKLDSAHAAATLTRDAAHRNRLGKAGRFPRPIHLGGGRRIAFVEAEIDAYVEAQIAARDAEQGAP